MLDNETKRRIDTARDILVGKVPDPKSQVEQITIALIYKFMDDMDKEAVEMGGKAGFFAGDYQKYAWSKIFAPQLGGFEMLALYADAITRMAQNPNLPQLFRDIFKNAYLPYRDPETLKLFLKTINAFSYDHSERLGDAFEYLLSVLGSQGDAGQFRTPRHIIDFMVQVVAPQKTETILDPACGTAGFLISSFKYILKNNTKKTPGDRLTTDERKKLLANFKGYDISPDMVRLSLVNLYLHGFVQPQILEYDTLSSEDRWNEYADVIMANPPFMSPKGGIKPHKKFSVQSNRSEVLFVDYIAEHLRPTGRAAIIVPEGIIFQSAGAYKQLRKMLVDKYLYAVVSLPAGVFNPYSGVKTSILFLDVQIARKTDAILFVKIENDGFGLGAQRREIAENDLPDAANVLADYIKTVRSGVCHFDEQSEEKSFNVTDKPCCTLLVKKEKLAENGEYNLTGERYRIALKRRNQKWPIVQLGEVSEVISGQSPEGEYYNDKGKGSPFYQGKTEFTDKYLGKPVKWTTKETKIAENNDILISVRAPVGPVNITTQRICIGRGLAAIRPSDKILIPYLFSILKNKEKEIKGGGGSVFDSINRKDIENIKIPLPPLEVQHEIVTEIEGYQKLIDGARQVVENWKPQIDIDPKWQMVKLGAANIDIIDGDRGENYPKKEDFTPQGYCLFLNTSNVRQGLFNFDELQFISREKDEKLRKGKLSRNDIVLTTRGTVGNIALYNDDVPYDHVRLNSGMLILRVDQGIFDSIFILQLFLSDFVTKQMNRILSGSAQPQLPIRSIVDLEIPLPPIETQREIVTKIEAEREAVDGCRELIAIYEAKIKQVIDKVWEE